MTETLDAREAAYWHEKAADIDFRVDVFIADSYLPASGGSRFPKTSPIDGRPLAEVAAGENRDINRAVQAGLEAFPRWSTTAPRERKRVLQAFATGISAAREKLALTTVLEVGKPIASAFNEVDSAAECISYFAEAIDKLYGEIAPTDANTLTLIAREPFGVVGAVVPWNFPLAMAAWKLGPALAAGNCVVLKPAEQSPLATLFLGEIAAEAGLPPGVLSIVPGFGETAGAAIGLHPQIGAVTFTGSTQVGKMFLRYAAESNMKDISLECGGKSPNIILDDFRSLELAARVAAEAICTNSGQSCNAGSRLLISRSRQDEFVDLLSHELERWQPADPFEPYTRMGTLVDERQLDRVLSYVQRGRADGATLVSGGNRLREESGGFYIEPTLFTEVDNRSQLAREEVFGPVLATLAFDSIDEAVALANDSSYGLAAGLWTHDVSKAHRIARALRAGVVYVNCYDRGEFSVPFGGFNESGIGVDKSLHGIEKYTRIKATWFDLSVGT